MIYTYVATALAAAAIGFSGAWKVQGWRMDAQAAERLQQAQQAEREARNAERKRQENVQLAQRKATGREIELRGQVDSARTEFIRLLASSDIALSRAQQDHATCIDRATAIKVVFDQCAGTLRGLAEKADRHTLDIKHMQESVPVQQEKVTPVTAE